MRYNAGLFAQDQWRLNRFTVNYGVRFDMLNARVDEQDITSGRFTPARSFDAVENVPNWKDIDPRVGVSWDIFGDGKTAVKASIGRYVVGESYTIARAVNPVQSTVNQVTRTWAPPAGVVYTGTYNPFDDCDLLNPNANTKRPGQVSCGAINNPLFGQVQTRTTNYDPAIVDGWHVRPNNWEGQISIQREIAPRVSVYAGYTRRWYRQPHGDAESQRDQRRLHAVLRAGAGRLAAAERRQSTVRPLRREPHHRAQQPDLQLERHRRHRGRLRRLRLRRERAAVEHPSFGWREPGPRAHQLLQPPHRPQPDDGRVRRQHAENRGLLRHPAADAAAGQRTGRVSNPAVGHQHLGNVPEPVGAAAQRQLPADQRDRGAVARPALHRRAADG